MAPNVARSIFPSNPDLAIILGVWQIFSETFYIFCVLGFPDSQISRRRHRRANSQIRIWPLSQCTEGSIMPQVALSAIYGISLSMWHLWSLLSESRLPWPCMLGLLTVFCLGRRRSKNAVFVKASVQTRATAQFGSAPKCVFLRFGRKLSQKLSFYCV